MLSIQKASSSLMIYKNLPTMKLNPWQYPISGFLIVYAVQTLLSWDITSGSLKNYSPGKVLPKSTSI